MRAERTPTSPSSSLLSTLREAIAGSDQDFTTGPLPRAVLLLAVPMVLAGDAAIAMRALSGANAVNIVLGPCLIFGLGPFPALGLTGAAVATTIGRSSGVAWQLWQLGRGKGRLALRRRHFRLDLPVMIKLARLAAGGVGQYLVATASYIALLRIMALFGSAALAGYTIAIRIIIFTILPSWGLSNAAATLVGQNLGAGKPERAERAAWITGHYNMAFLAAISLVFFAAAPALVGIFTSDPAVAGVAAQSLRWIASCYVFYAYGLVLMQALNGAGDTVTPTLLNFLCYWVCQIPLAWFAARHTAMGPSGVLLAIAISETLFAVLAVMIFRRGKWKTRRV